MKKIIPVLLIIISFFAVAPFFKIGFFPMHDDTQVVRVQQMAKALSDGQFPVRWVSDLGYGYGYPIYNFYAPLPYYFGGFINLLGFDALTAAKAMFVFPLILSSLTMYFFAAKVWGKTGGFLSAILYLYAPYHALNIYVRGAVGEIWTMAFLPLVFYGIYSILESKRQKEKLNSKGLNIGILGLSGIILSHNITGMLAVLILFIFFLGATFIYKDKKIFLSFLFMLSIGLLLSAFFVLPAIFEMEYTNVDKIIGGTADFRKHFVDLDQLWDSSWGFAGSAPGRADGMSFKIGKLHLIMALLGLFIVIVRSKLGLQKKINLVYILWFLFALLVFPIFMTAKSSQFIWEALPFLEYVQYPWRFLVFIVFSVSFFGGAGVILLQSKFRLIAVFLLSAAILLLNIKYFQPQEYLSVDSNYYINELNIRWRTSKISDEYLPKNFPIPMKEDEIAKTKFSYNDSLSILSQHIKTQELEAHLFVQEPTDIKINIAYFPGWRVMLDGKQTNFAVRDGVITTKIPQGEHNLQVIFQNTPVRIVANLITLLSLPLLFDKIRRRLFSSIYG